MIKKQLCNKSTKKLDLCNTQDKVKGMVNDRLEILKKKCEQEIKEAENNLRVLKAKLANLISLAHESEKLANPESEPDKYSDIGLTEAVLQAVKDLWEARKAGASVTEIKNHLLAHGFQAGENFETAIYTVLSRLCESRKIILEEKPTDSFGAMNIKLGSRKIYYPTHQPTGSSLKKGKITLRRFK